MSFLIPPIEELAAFYDNSSGACSLWTWDWYLPQLTELKLTGGFASRFQFRMLRGCLALRQLGLNMTNDTDMGKHIRILTIYDFSAPDTRSDTTVTFTNTTSINTDVQTQTLPTSSYSSSIPHRIWRLDPRRLYHPSPPTRDVSHHPPHHPSSCSSTPIANTLRTTSRSFLDLSLSCAPPSVEYSLKEWVMDKRKSGISRSNSEANGFSCSAIQRCLAVAGTRCRARDETYDGC